MFGLFKKKNDTATDGCLIVFDIGGTKMRVACDRGGVLGNVQVRATPHDPASGLADMVRLAKDCAGRENIRAALGCIAGKVSASGVLSGARNLRAWEGTNLVEKLQSELKAPVHIYNDCELIGVGEAREGAGVGANVLAYLTVSTGVGGARIVSGEIDTAASDFIVGRIPVGDSDLEDMISGTAVKKRFGVDPWKLTSLEERTKLADILAVALTEVIERWHPDTIVLGGSMMVGKDNTIPLERVVQTLRAHTDTPHMPKLRLATLGDIGGLHGARIVARTQGI